MIGDTSFWRLLRKDLEDERHRQAEAIMRGVDVDLYRKMVGVIQGLDMALDRGNALFKQMNKEE